MTSTVLPADAAQLPAVSPSVSRLASLDGLRGLASLGVVLSHVAALSYVPWGPRPPTAAEFLGWHLGAPAVDLFFVLSGLVLTHSLRRHPAFWRYLKRRALRLLPVAYFGVVLGFAARLAAGMVSDRHLSGFSVLITDELTAPLTSADLRGLLLPFTGSLDANHLNPPLWTLIVELQMTLLMPLIARVARRSDLLVPVGLGIIPVAALVWYQGLFLPIFLLGAVLASAGPLPGRWRVPALTLGLALLFIRHLTGEENVFMRFVSAPGAALLILVTLSSSPAWLDLPALQWLGRVSFSLYIVHFPVLLLGTVLLVMAGMSVSLAGLLMVPICLLAAALSYHVVERPLLALLRRQT